MLSETIAFSFGVLLVFYMVEPETNEMFILSFKQIRYVLISQ